MNRPIWISLALLHDSKMAMVDWRRLLAGHFDCVQRYLEKCPGEIAGTLPCPRSGQRLHVGKREGMYVAFPEEGFEGDSDSLADLTEDDVALWRLERDRLELDLCRALGLTPLERTAGLSKLLSLIGTAGQGKSRKRVYLGYASNERAGVDVCMAVARESQCPCCVALPVFYPACDEMLRRSDFEYIVLEEAVTLGVSGMVGKPLRFPVVTTETKENAAMRKANNSKSEQLKKYVFRHTGDFWEIIFEGHALPPVRHLAGLTYIHALLSDPGKEISALSLYEIENPPPPEPKGTLLSLEERERFGTGGSHQPILDKTAPAQLKKAREALEAKLTDSQLSENEREYVADQIEAINNAMSNIRVARATGGAMFECKAMKQPRQAVSKSIEAAFTALAKIKHGQKVAKHLRYAIRKGTTLMYPPGLSWSWQT